MFRRALGFFTPDPVLPDLDRLKGVSLFPHQADGVAFLLSKRRAILADDMGWGNPPGNGRNGGRGTDGANSRREKD